MISPLHHQHLSLNHEALIHLLANHQNLLIVQDLDGVCMKLVKDPLTRQMDPSYISAVRSFDSHFYVLTNGEHIGSRGVNRMVEQAQSDLPTSEQKYYLPGLAAGGVQWQTRQGAVSHPGVRDEILYFLNTIPPKMTHCIREFFARQESTLDASTLDTCLNAAILDNKVSPTVNLNVFYDTLSDRPHLYQSLQKAIVQLTTDLLAEAKQQGLENTFFIHYAPNLGQDAQGNEMIQLAEGNDSGTTDFQFMLKGARKEVGLLFLLNQYYGHHQGNFPLGKDFHVLDAPQDHSALLKIVQNHFDPAVMPLIVGVGDTVTSKGEMINGELKFFRGGSDRGFLQLIQMMGEAFDSPNVTVYVDSSGGEVKNRKAIAVESRDGQEILVDGPTDSRDRSDPLRLNVVIPGGYVQYVSLFNKAAARRGYHSDRGQTTV